jgi:NADPH:quinone reductase-like Zn-dependent oxidoreductase
MARTSLARGRRVVCALAPGGLKDMLEVRELAEAGAIRAILDKRFPMGEAAEAVRYLESGRAEGKVALVMGEG